MPALAEVHLVSNPDDPFHPFRSQMISLSDHLADQGEPLERATLHATQGVGLEMRHDAAQEVGYERASYFQVRSERDSLIQPHPK